MKRKFFGTDGIRGKANYHPMTCEMAISLGRAVTSYFSSHTQKKRPVIIVGKDTRLSCYMLEMAIAAGVCSQGGEVILTGPLPTPGVAFVTESMRADVGVMISASHNPYYDNGIKIFDSKGHKLPDEVEIELERLMTEDGAIPVLYNEALGNATRLSEVFGRYIVHVKSALHPDVSLEKMRIVLDCAHGATYKVAPMIFQELGAEIVTCGITPNGQNINLNCGSLHPQMARDMVKKYRSDIGLCFDGDGDRLVVIDHRGDVIEGDKIIAICAKLLLQKGLLKKGDTVVGTVMTNLGLEKYLKKLGLKLHRTDVGDRYIVEYMRKNNCLLGGEPSGHIIFSQYATTGDGILAALKILEASHFFKKSVKELASDVELYPQVVKNVEVKKKIPFENLPETSKTLKEVEKGLGDEGRFLLRYSGTESLARVMVEAQKSEDVEDFSEQLVDVLSKELQ